MSYVRSNSNPNLIINQVQNITQRVVQPKKQPILYKRPKSISISYHQQDSQGLIRILSFQQENLQQQQPVKVLKITQSNQNFHQQLGQTQKVILSNVSSVSRTSPPRVVVRKTSEVSNMYYVKKLQKNRFYEPISQNSISINSTTNNSIPNTRRQQIGQHINQNIQNIQQCQQYQNQNTNSNQNTYRENRNCNINSNSNSSRNNIENIFEKLKCQKQQNQKIRLSVEKYRKDSSVGPVNVQNIESVFKGNCSQQQIQQNQQKNQQSSRNQQQQQQSFNNSSSNTQRDNYYQQNTKQNPQTQDRSCKTNQNIQNQQIPNQQQQKQQQQLQQQQNVQGKNTEAIHKYEIDLSKLQQQIKENEQYNKITYQNQSSNRNNNNNILPIGLNTQEKKEKEKENSTNTSNYNTNMSNCSSSLLSTDRYLSYSKLRSKSRSKNLEYSHNKQYRVNNYVLPCDKSLNESLNSIQIQSQNQPKKKENNLKINEILKEKQEKQEKNEKQYTNYANTQAKTTTTIQNSPQKAQKTVQSDQCFGSVQDIEIVSEGVMIDFGKLEQNVVLYSLVQISSFILQVFKNLQDFSQIKDYVYFQKGFQVNLFVGGRVCCVMVEFEKEDEEYLKQILERLNVGYLECKIVYILKKSMGMLKNYGEFNTFQQILQLFTKAPVFEIQLDREKVYSQSNMLQQSLKKNYTLVAKINKNYPFFEEKDSGFRNLTLLNLVDIIRLKQQNGQIVQIVCLQNIHQHVQFGKKLYLEKEIGKELRAGLKKQIENLEFQFDEVNVFVQYELFQVYFESVYIGYFQPNFVGQSVEINNKNVNGRRSQRNLIQNQNFALEIIVPGVYFMEVKEQGNGNQYDFQLFMKGKSACNLDNSKYFREIMSLNEDRNGMNKMFELNQGVYQLEIKNQNQQLNQLELNIYGQNHAILN